MNLDDAFQGSPAHQSHRTRSNTHAMRPRRLVWFWTRCVTATLTLICGFPVAAASEQPLHGYAFDLPGDAGGSLGLRWRAAFRETPDTRYQVMLSERPEGPFEPLVSFSATSHYESERRAPWWLIGNPEPGTHFLELRGTADAPLVNGTRYFLKISARINDRYGEQRFESPVYAATPRPNWFRWTKLNNFVLMLAFSAVVFLSIRRAGTRQHTFLRRIPGIAAIEEAVDRAAETGRPILYLTGSGELAGRGDASNLSTIAATVILGEVVKRAVRRGTSIKVPHRSAVVMAISQEIVHEAYLTAGRRDLYSEDINFFITADQFAYTAAVNGIMLRERPAAHFFLGYYYAESLLLAETGTATGALQIAGTDAEHQLPFFITTCDYTLIGEELYAASAYLSRAPALVGALHGQDVGKGFILAGLVSGSLLLTLGELTGLSVFETVFQIFHDFR